MNDAEAERVAPLIPQNLRKYHCSKRDEGLTERVISAKIGQPADMNIGIMAIPSVRKQTFDLSIVLLCSLVTGCLVKIAHFCHICEAFACSKLRRSVSSSTTRISSTTGVTGAGRRSKVGGSKDVS